MNCVRCGATLDRRQRIADSNGVAGQEYKCPDCGVAGCDLDTGKQIGPALDQDALSRPLTAADGGDRR